MAKKRRSNFDKEMRLAAEHVKNGLKNKTVKKAIVYGSVFTLGAIVAHGLARRK